MKLLSSPKSLIPGWKGRGRKDKVIAPGKPKDGVKPKDSDKPKDISKPKDHSPKNNPKPGEESAQLVIKPEAPVKAARMRT